MKPLLVTLINFEASSLVADRGLLYHSRNLYIVNDTTIQNPYSLPVAVFIFNRIYDHIITCSRSLCDIARDDVNSDERIVRWIDQLNKLLWCSSTNYYGRQSALYRPMHALDRSFSHMIRQNGRPFLWQKEC